MKICSKYRGLFEFFNFLFKFHRAFSVRAYFDNVSDLEHTVELHFDEKLLPGYGWVFPISEKIAKAGVMILNNYSFTRD